MKSSIQRASWFVVAFACALLSGDTLRAGPLDPASVGGSYHGFFQSQSTTGLWGYLNFAIDGDSIRNRRWTGTVTMILPAGASPIVLPFPVDGTISASGEFTGNGRSPAGSVLFHGQIMLLQGGAAIVDSTYKFCASPPDPNTPPDPCDQGTSNLIRNFVSDEPAPNLNGRWDGLYSSFGRGGNGTFMLDVKQCAVPPSPGVELAPALSHDFAGTEVIDGNRDEPYFFIGNFGPDNMFVVAGWSATGDHFFVTGNYSPPDPNKNMASADGLYALTMANGITDRGELHDWVQTTMLPPDPCVPIQSAGH
jgi:hypothetical protein